VADPLTDSPFGPLTIVEVFEYFDGPRLFLCRSDARQLFLAYWVDSHEQEEDWYLIPISRIRIRLLKALELDLRTAVKNSEGGMVWKLHVANGQLDSTPVNARDISDDTLPTPGIFLRQQTKSPSVLKTDESDLEALETFRETVAARRVRTPQGSW
jgi:uncharacterized protein DUF6575